MRSRPAPVDGSPSATAISYRTTAMSDNRPPLTAGGTMSPFELVRFAVGAIAAHPLRSALTSLGVVIGVAAVIMMTSIGLGAQQRVEEALSSLGTN
ncbi:MAG TPA: peptide ABC transporter permease, partial [Brevundimonas sp.]|nr:peptide ABC transporter permease [Brevundimonas sp.]